MSIDSENFSDPIWSQVSAKLSQGGVRPATLTERQLMFRKVRWLHEGSKSGMTKGSESRAPYTEEVETRATFLAYRLLRWLLIGLGWSNPADPLGFATEIRSQKAPSGPLGFWSEPLPRKALHEAGTTQPGLYALQRALAQSPDGLFLQPPPENAPEEHKLAFVESMIAGIDALKLGIHTEEDLHLGLMHIDARVAGPAVYPHANGSCPYLDDAIYTYILQNFPSPEKLLEFEQGFLTVLSETLADTNEDQLRMWVRQKWLTTDYEAFSLTQTAKRWAAALRPIELDIERSVLVRKLEQAGERARKALDHRAEIMASTQIARVLGLSQVVVQNASEEFADAAESAYLEGQEIHNKALQASKPPSLEDYQAAKYDIEDISNTHEADS